MNSTNSFIVIALLVLWLLNRHQQQKQFGDLAKNQIKIIRTLNQLSTLNQLNELDNKLDRIKSEIIKRVQENNQKITDSKSSLYELLNQQQVNKSLNTQQSNQQPNTSNLNSIAIVDKVSQLVATYNQNKNSISDKVKAMVGETQESINQRRTGNIDIVTLENTTQKKYWIIELDNDYYLIPHAKIKIDEYNRTTLESLFDCTNFTSEYLDFQLVKPAKVSQLSSETWQLEEKGKLDFY